MLKSLVKGPSYVIFLNQRAWISGFDHFSLWISCILLVFVARSQKLTIEKPLECQILLCGNSKRTISLEHRYKNVTFTVPQTWLCAFQKQNGEHCLKFYTKDYSQFFTTINAKSSQNVNRVGIEFSTLKMLEVQFYSFNSTFQDFPRTEKNWYFNICLDSHRAHNLVIKWLSKSFYPA